jgi:hypothetical protein
MDQVKTMESGLELCWTVPGLNYRCIYMMRPLQNFLEIYFRLRQLQRLVLEGFTIPRGSRKNEAIF